MKEVLCRTQKELDTALKDGHSPVLIGDGDFIVTGTATVDARENISVEARDNAKVRAAGNVRVRLKDNATVDARDNTRVVARDNTRVVARGVATVNAYGNAHVRAMSNSHVNAYGNATVRAMGNSRIISQDHSMIVAAGNTNVLAHGKSSVIAYDNVNICAREHASVKAVGNVNVIALNNVHVKAVDKYVTIKILTKTVKATGGTIIRVYHTHKTIREWCGRYGLKIIGRGKKQHVILYKGVNKDFKTRVNDFDYTPGTTPVAPDWDGGIQECGRGLHFSPTPIHTFKFSDHPERFVACPVLLSDMRLPRSTDNYPDKIKAKGCCAPVWEVDIDGNKIKS